MTVTRLLLYLDNPVTRCQDLSGWSCQSNIHHSTHCSPLIAETRVWRRERELMGGREGVNGKERGREGGKEGGREGGREGRVLRDSRP